MPSLESYKSLSQRTLETAARRVQRLAASAAGDPNAPIANGLFIFYLAIAFVALAIVVEAVREWHHGAGEGSIFVDVLWRVTWIASTVYEVVLIMLLAIWVYRRFQYRKKEPGD